MTEKWLDTDGQYLDMITISCDSFDPETNLGRDHASIVIVFPAALELIKRN